MKRQASLCESSSTKRLRLEYEIFSTSIQDIEKMFTEEILTAATSTTNNQPYNPDSCQYLDTVVPSTNFKYDCINMAFLEEKKPTAPLPPPSPQHQPPPQTIQMVPQLSPPEKSTYLDLNTYRDYDDDDDDLQNYRPSITQDLLMIEQLILFNK
ncbi:hypothetical protein Cantr_04610 [Candida viswanathii]|uniref:Uncharacterized protein n=1 Tax=Candida viswanathii TaxID=5486 RepID=A0A367XNH8_9ASCO|nr:hypothetical protein Cantr_04610 [Candida viswanathii]